MSKACPGKNVATQLSLKTATAEVESDKGTDVVWKVVVRKRRKSTTGPLLPQQEVPAQPSIVGETRSGAASTTAATTKEPITKKAIEVATKTTTT